MKSLIRSLNERGQARFRSWLDAGATGDAPFDLLHDPHTSDPVPDTGEIDQTHFANRYELAVHIAEALSRCDFQRLGSAPGVWAWLSLFYFDLLCPPDLTRARRVRALDRYLLNPDSRRAPSHLIREAVLAVRSHSNLAKVLLISPRGGIKDNVVLSELSDRQELIGNSAVVHLASLLYFDQRRGGLRRGVASRRLPGAVQRFALVLQQLSLNYDLPAMDARQIAILLPEEFNHWKQRAKLDDDAKTKATH
jgi:hypothetical protein